MRDGEPVGHAAEDGHVLEIPAEVVNAIGRVTLAAGDLEVVLAVISAGQTQENTFVILAKPGEPLRAARRSVAATASPYREAYLPALERAAELLAKRHSVVHVLLINETVDQPLEGWAFLHYRTYDRHPADPRHHRPTSYPASGSRGTFGAHTDRADQSSATQYRNAIDGRRSTLSKREAIGHCGSPIARLAVGQ
jgi:hypothetical protein